MPYTPNPQDPTQPVDTVDASTAAAEFRALKLFMYEANVWTPTDASGATLVFTSALGYYTRIGRIIFFSCHVAYPATANGANAIIGGLPFTCKNNLGARGVVNIIASAAANKPTAGLVVQNTSTILLYKTDDYTPVINSDLSANSLDISGWFIDSQ